MLKLYNDTELYIDESQNKIIVTRGYWNFIRVNISYDNDKEKELIYRLFKDMLEGKVVLKDVKKYKDSIERLIQAGFIYESDYKSNDESRILLITDNEQYMVSRINKTNIKDKFEVMTTDKFTNELLGKTYIYELKQDPLKAYNIKRKMNEYLQENNLNLIVVFLSKVNDALCKTINYLIDKKEVVYSFIDNEFGYLFGVKKKYTGCYECFSNRMIAKMKIDKFNYQPILHNNSSLDEESKYTYDLMFVHVLKCCCEYIKTGVVPISGRILAAFSRTLEVRYENLLRLSFCPICGYIGQQENAERNVKLKRILKSLENESALSVNS